MLDKKSELEHIAYLAGRWQSVKAWELSEKLAEECRQLRISIQASANPWSELDFQWCEVGALSMSTVDYGGYGMMFGTADVIAAKKHYRSTLRILLNRERQVEEIAGGVARVLPDCGHEIVRKMSPNEWTARDPEDCASRMKRLADMAASDASRLPDPQPDTTFDDIIAIQELASYGYSQLKTAAECGYLFRKLELTSSIRQAIDKIGGCSHYDAYDIIAAMRTPHEREAVQVYYEASMVTRDMAELRKCVKKTMPEMLYCVRELDFVGDNSIDINRSAELLEELQAECEEVRKLRKRLARETARMATGSLSDAPQTITSEEFAKRVLKGVGTVRNARNKAGIELYEKRGRTELYRLDEMLKMAEENGWKVHSR